MRGVTYVKVNIRPVRQGKTYTNKMLNNNIRRIGEKIKVAYFQWLKLILHVFKKTLLHRIKRKFYILTGMVT